MKALTFLITLLAILFIRCKSNSKAQNISDTYVLHTNGEYAIDYDTLIVLADPKSTNTYNIQNNSGFQKFSNGAIMLKELKKTSWIANWNEDKQLLSETDLDRQMQFKDNNKTFVLKNSTYQKIK